MAKHHIFITGGAGYVGSRLVPFFLDQGHKVTVYDLFIYGDVLPQHDSLSLCKGDIRDQKTLRSAMKGCDVVIHLACISNDPSFDLNADLGKTINYDAFEPMVQIAKQEGIKRFIYASSSSVYGIKNEPEVIETLPLEPLTDYSKYKAMCEDVLWKYTSPDFVTVAYRPATICGYAKRQRLDVIVNILTNHAVNTGKIKIFGGTQKRPNLHIDDQVGAINLLLNASATHLSGQVYNVGFENHTVSVLADMVCSVVGEHVTQEVVETNDNRSYHISSQKIQTELGFNPAFSIEKAIQDLVQALKQGLLPDSMERSEYFNIKKMQEINLA